MKDQSARSIQNVAVVNDETATIYCPRCRAWRPRREWRRLWRHIQSGTKKGSPISVLRHRGCREIVYLLSDIMEAAE